MFNEIDKNNSGSIGITEFKDSVLSTHLSAMQINRVVSNARQKTLLKITTFKLDSFIFY